MSALLPALLAVTTAALDSAPGAGAVVASVRIAAPEADVERLSRYVEVKTGEPLRPEVVRHVVELFYATGDYEDVIVEAEPGPAGLDVVFRPIPAPLLADVTVEGDRVVPAKEVARIARLRSREPLWPPRLERAARDVALALAARGYLEARVSAAARRRSGGADAVFTVHAGPKARVGAARIEGAGGHEVILRRYIRPAPGRVFHREKARSGAEAMRRQLVRDGYWRAQVELEEAYDPATGRVTLVFRTERGPMCGVEFQGARLGRSQRAGLESLLRDGGLKPDVLEEAVDRLENEFHQDGYRDVSITRHEETRGYRQVVVYVIQAGPQASVASVRIDADVTDLTWPRTTTQPGLPLQDAVASEDARAIGRVAEQAGHAAARVEVVTPEGGGNVPVVFKVRAGPRTLVSSVDVDTPAPLPADSPASELVVRPGAPYRVRDVARDRNALLTAYRDAGYPQVEVTPETTLSEDRLQAKVVLHVVPGSRLSVDHVVVAGLERTEETVVRREITLHEGKPLGQQEVIESQRRLGALGLFQKVSVAEIDPETTGQRTILVTAEEGPLTTVSYGLGYSETDLLRGSVEVTRRNLFGMDRAITAFARLSFTGSRFLLTYREPYFLGRRQEMFATAFREEGERPFFDFLQHGAVLQSARDLSTHWSLIARAGYKRVHVFNVTNPGEVSREFGNYTVSGPSASLVNDTRDDPLEPHRGRFLSADLSLSLKALGGDTFVKGFVQAAAFERLTSRVLLAVDGRLGLGRTLGLEESIFLPKAERFYAGGDYSLRGFCLDCVLPSGGNALVLASTELRTDVGRHLSTALFVDAGNVYPLGSDLSLGDLRYSAGVGLRYRTALGPLRVDWGYKLNRRPGESASQWHLAIGHVF